MDNRDKPRWTNKKLEFIQVGLGHTDNSSWWILAEKKVKRGGLGLPPQANGRE